MVFRREAPRPESENHNDKFVRDEIMNETTISDGMLDVRGVPLQVVREGAGKTLLLLHGGTGLQTQAPFFLQLTQHFDVIAPTHPGFAETPLPGHFDCIDDLAYLYLDLMDQLAIEDAILMGITMGGWVAAEIATKSTARLAKLILVDAVGIKVGNRYTRDIADIFALPAEEVASLAYHDRANAPNFSALSEETLVPIARSREALVMYTWEPYMHNPKLKARLQRIDIPTQLIWGASDGIVTTAYAEAYRDSIPGAELSVIKKAGHNPQIEQPEAFVERVLAFAG